VLVRAERGRDDAARQQVWEAALRVVAAGEIGELGCDEAPVRPP